MHAIAPSALNGGVETKTYDKLKDELNLEDDDMKPFMYSVNAKFTANMRKLCT